MADPLPSSDAEEAGFGRALRVRQHGTSSSAREAHPLPLPPGSRLGPYRIEALIGEGGMARVYRARHALLQREVAIKTLRPELADHPENVERFLAETRAANLIGHDHVVQITDFVREAGSIYCVMELLDGEDLGALQAREGRLPLTRALRIALQLCDALAAVHRAGIVHRDLKPENIFIVPSNREHDFVKLLDFGIAKLSAAAGEGMQPPSFLMGTPAYMAPEQAGAEDVDPRTDIYAFGVILFELVTGTLPFEAETLRDLLVEVVTSAPPTPSKLVELPEQVAGLLDALILQCLEKEADDRPQAIEDVGRRLRPILEAYVASSRARSPVPRRSAQALDRSRPGLQVATRPVEPRMPRVRQPSLAAAVPAWMLSAALGFAVAYAGPWLPNRGLPRVESMTEAYRSQLSRWVAQTSAWLARTRAARRWHGGISMRAEPRAPAPRATPGEIGRDVSISTVSPLAWTAAWEPLACSGDLLAE